MNCYERLLIKESKILINDQADLDNNSGGFYIKTSSADIILINRNIINTYEKKCILAEELGHYYTSYGNITDQTDIRNRKQEMVARRWAVKRLITLENLIDAFNNGVRNKHELAEHLEVTEEFLHIALDHFKGIYGYSYSLGEYTIYFDPLWIAKKLE